MTDRYQNCRTYDATVIIPTYNRSNLLVRTLRSLSSQTMDSKTRFEVIICDDGSSEDTMSIVRDFSSAFECKYAFYPDHGYHPARARNMGIRLAEGRICIFLDCGVLAGSNFVDSHIESHTNSENAAVIGCCLANNSIADTSEMMEGKINFDDIDETISRMAGDEEMSDVRNLFFTACGDDLSNLDTAWALFWGANISARTTSIREVGGFDENYTQWSVEDIDLGLALMLQGARFILSRNATTICMPHDKDIAAREKSYTQNAAYLHNKFQNARTAALIRMGGTDELVEDELRRRNLNLTL